MENKILYTVTIFSENTVGLLNQVTAVFTRRQLNIETLSVSPSAIEGIHKFTITAFSDRETIEKVVLSIDKKVDVLKSYYNTDEELIHQEIAMYKLSTPEFLQQVSVEQFIRKHSAIILDINQDTLVIEKTGHYGETQALFNELNEKVRVLQFIRSGRIAITRSKTERLSDMLAEIEEKRKKKEKKITR
ncbi:MAG: acetolactate synthase small subunit [Bacteroidales bacterium]|jgi:acetolactate synthase-1/3 small subunit|nr:acetolactate synthase small subunit [Bacteroidales bacterium]